MKIIQVSDLHITESTNLINCEDKIDRLFDAVQREINTDEKVIFCVCGDIIDRKSKNGYVSADRLFKYIKKTFSSFNFSLVFVPGNHDLVDNSFQKYDDFIQQFIDEENYRYENNPVITLKYENINLVLLNSIYHQDYKYGAINIRELQKHLKECQNKTVIVSHHTLMSRYDCDDSSIRNSYNVVDLISTHKVFAVLHGHTHGYSDIIIGQSCKVIGVGPMFKDIPDIPNQFNFINIIADDIDKIDNFSFRADVSKYVRTNLYVRKNVGYFDGENLEEVYKDVVERTKSYGCIYSFNMSINTDAQKFYNDIERTFGGQISIAEQWQKKDCPDSLYYNHGMYFDKGNINGLDYIVKELNGKATSSRAILPLVNTEDVKMSGDGFFPSLDVIQFGFDDELKTNLHITIYLRALEVNHFLKINLCEVYLMAKHIQEKIRSINKLIINIIAFRAQYKENYGCFQKAELDRCDKDDIMLIVSDHNISKIKNLLINKLELSETVIIEDGVTNLCSCITKYDKLHPGFYRPEMISELSLLKEKYYELKKIRNRTSIYEELQSIEQEVTDKMNNVIQLFAKMEA